MRTAVADTSIGSYREHRDTGRSAAQRDLILSYITKIGGNWSIGELAQAMQLDKSSVSARVNELLYETCEVVAAPKRKDLVSGKLVRPVTLAPVQRELFQ